MPNKFISTPELPMNTIFKIVDPNSAFRGMIGKIGSKRVEVFGMDNYYYATQLIDFATGKIVDGEIAFEFIGDIDTGVGR